MTRPALRLRRAARHAAALPIAAPLRRWIRAGDGARAAERDADRQYTRWLRVHRPGPADLRRMRDVAASWTRRPLISVLVPVYNPDPAWLEAMISSVAAQVYDDWELCIADDLSTDPRVAAVLHESAAREPRIRVAFRTENGNIAAASNTALDLATGEYVALLDHDDILQPHALYAVAATLRDDPAADMVFSDEDKILIDGSRGQVTFKGGFDPDHLLSTNYVCHLSVFRRSLVDVVGGFREGFDGSQDHDLALRVSERAATIRHVPDVLYSWKQVPGSAALAYDEKPAAWLAGLAAVQDALDRRDSGSRAQLGPGPGTYTVRHPVPSACRVHVVLLADDPHVIEQSRAALADNPGLAGVAWTVRGAGDAARSSRAAVLNAAARTAECDVLVFVDGDLVPSTAGTAWLTPLVEQALRDPVGVSGGRILTVDGAPEHEGLHVGGPAIATSIGVRYPVIQRTAAITGACMAVRSDVFARIGGFDERFIASLHDVDLCLRVRQAGLACIYTPLTELRRLRTSQRRPAAGRADEATFHATWDRAPVFSDPFVSPWLRSVRPLDIRDG